MCEESIERMKTKGMSLSKDSLKIQEEDQDKSENVEMAIDT